MLAFPIFFKFFLLAFVGTTVEPVANSKKDIALLAGVFILGLGALEAVLALFGVSSADRSRVAHGLTGDWFGKRSHTLGRWLRRSVEVPINWSTLVVTRVKDGWMHHRLLLQQANMRN